MVEMNVAFISAIAGIVVFLLSHLGVAIWFASKMNTRIAQIASSVVEMTNDIKVMALMNTRITVLESRINRTEEDMRETIKAAALVKNSQ